MEPSYERPVVAVVAGPTEPPATGHPIRQAARRGPDVRPVNHAITSPEFSVAS